MEVFVTPTPEDAARRAAGVVIEAVAEAVSAGRTPVVGLATGSSPLGLYAELAVAVEQGRVDFSAAYGFALDEYVGLPVGHPQSYREVLVAEVCRRAGLAPERLHLPDGSGRTEVELAAGAARYEALIRGVGGIDVQVLGIGANGHIGFNEPGSSLTSRTRVKRLSSRTRADNARFFDSPHDVPTHCVTQGLGTVLEARRLVLVATGTAKADAVAAAVEGPLTASCPGSVLQFHADAVVIVDEAAAARLRNREYYDDSAAGL